MISGWGFDQFWEAPRAEPTKTKRESEAGPGFFSITPEYLDQQMGRGPPKYKKATRTKSRQSVPPPAEPVPTYQEATGSSVKKATILSKVMSVFSQRHT